MAAFLVVLGAQWWLVAAAGTDIPFHDQWDIEGRWLYPRWLGGAFGPADWVHSANENRLFWTYALDLSLLKLNGQWDPLVQLVANAVLRAACAGVLVALLIRNRLAPARGVIAAGIAVAFLPQLAWHNALWAIESHAYFALGFVVLTLALLEPAERPGQRTLGGILAGVAALVAMSPAALALPALLALSAMRAIEERRWHPGGFLRQTWPALGLLLLALALRVPVPGHASMRPASVGEFLAAAGRLLAWPHSGAPFAALAMNLPLILVVGARLAGRRRAVAGEDFVLLLGFWSAAVAVAGAWMRGGNLELAVGVPSRYVDFLVLLPIANTWCAVALCSAAAARWRPVGRMATGAWACFLLIGWLGLSMETMRGVILPRSRDTLAPVRLARAFQLTDDPAVFTGQPRLLVPHPDLATMRAVLHDPLLQGRLPPSLQPEKPMGPLSRAVRWLLRR